LERPPAVAQRIDVSIFAGSVAAADGDSDEVMGVVGHAAARSPAIRFGF